MPASERGAAGVEALRPTERVAGVLAGRESVAACELLLLRARADLDAGRAREAAMQLRTAWTRCSPSATAFMAEGQDKDFEALTAGTRGRRRRRIGRPDEPNRTSSRRRSSCAALAVAERVLRRERASR